MHFKFYITHMNANIKEQVSFHTISVILAALTHTHTQTPPKNKKPHKTKSRKIQLCTEQKTENVAVSHQAEHVETNTFSIWMKQQKVLKDKICHGNIYECCLNYITK